MLEAHRSGVEGVDINPQLSNDAIKTVQLQQRCIMQFDGLDGRAG